MISVVIPLYNKEKQIGNTLNSVFNQTFQDFEIVIVNDGSTDNSVDAVKQINDNRIRLINQVNQGVSVARNRGIEEARFDYVAFLDADDEWNPAYLETQVKLIKNYPECQVFACAYNFRKGENLLPFILNKMPFGEEEDILSNYFDVASCSHPPIWTSAVIVEKKALLSIGNFPQGIVSGEDLLTWARLAVRYRIAYNKQSLATFVLEDTHFSASQPRRVPAEIDFVGNNLKELYKEFPSNGLKKYIALWHKMRASIYIRLNKRAKAFVETQKALYYNPFNVKMYIYLLLVFAPAAVQRKILKFDK